MLNFLVFVCLVYVVFLFAVAFLAEQYARRKVELGSGHLGFIPSRFRFIVRAGHFTGPWEMQPAVGLNFSQFTLAPLS